MYHLENSDYRTIYKTAHLLLSKHGETIIENIGEKKALYNTLQDREAVSILESVEIAAKHLLLAIPENQLPN